MKLVIEVPKEFEKDFTDDKFYHFFNRVICDIKDFDGACGLYELETVNMLQFAFIKAEEA